MVEALARLQKGTLSQTPQGAEAATYAPKIDKAEAHIDFARPAATVLRHIHGLSPFPGAWAMVALAGGSQRLKFLKAEVAEGRAEPGRIIDDDFAIACRVGAIRPLIIQREGKAPLSRREFLRGHPLKSGSTLS
jgi:methionyl-tRNA formyltransferase